MDWDKIELPEIKERSPKSGKLSTLDYWKIFVISKIIRKSVASVLQTAILTYLKRTWIEHEERLEVEARQLRISKEELFNKLVNNEIELD